MPRTALRSAVVAVLAVALAGSSTLFAGGSRISSIERYGLGGFIQPIGLHHGFHNESVVSGSPAAKDELKPHDIIVKVDGEAIRSLDHLRAALAEAYIEDEAVTITYTHGLSLEHHTLKCTLKPRADKKPADTKRPIDQDDDTR